MSVATVLVGKKKTGKTTLIKKLMMFFDMQRIVFDPNQNYSDLPNTYQWPNDDIDKFLSYVKPLRNKVIVIEEATINFDSNARNKELKSLLVRCRDSNQNNVLFLAFHSLRSFPTWIIDLTDAMYLFKTLDSDIVLKKFEGLIGIEEAWQEVCESEENHFSVFVPLQ